MNKLFILILILVSNTVCAEPLSCKKVAVKSKDVAMEETLELCFMGDPSYFISANCQDLKCKFVQKLKSTALKPSQKNRPGVAMCEALGGAHESVAIEGKITKRCVFSEDTSFISLNLLESWNGKKFTGPGKEMEF